jgi:8-oxo-dGTP pyrophosphatase MutT (NUDIX family)
MLLAMARFSDHGDEFTTYDGLPVSREPPHGASVVVRSPSPDGWRYLVLHRSHNGPDFEGDWAWTPPAGARFPGEDIAACATRELEEETGVRGSPVPLSVDGTDWAVFGLEVPWGTAVSIDGEHDRYEWLALEEACGRCLPLVVAQSLRLASRP